MPVASQWSIVMATVAVAAMPLAAQAGSSGARDEAVATVRDHAADDARVRAAAAAIVALLCDQEPGLRHLALAAVLRRPACFAAQMDALDALLLAGPPDDCVLHARTAVAPFRVAAAAPLSIGDALTALERGDQSAQDRAMRTLEQNAAQLLPHVDRLARLARRGAPDAFVPLLAGLHRRHSGEVFAALRRARESERRSSPNVVRLLGELCRDDRELCRELLEEAQINGEAARQRLEELARADGGWRERLATTAATEPVLARAALEVLQRLGRDAAPCWPVIEPCLRSGLLAPYAARIASAVRVEQPGAMLAVIAAIGDASPENVASLAMSLRELGAAAPPEAAQVLVARLPLPHLYSPYVMDALFVLGAHDALRGALPSLLAHDQAAVRARACLIGAATGALDDACRERIVALSREDDAKVRSAAVLAARLLADHVPRDELHQLVRQADVHRTLAAFAALRVRDGRPSIAEEHAAVALLRDPTFSVWQQDVLLRDLASRRHDVPSVTNLLRAVRWTDAGFEPRWRASAEGRDVLALRAAERTMGFGPEPMLAPLDAPRPAVQSLIEAATAPPKNETQVERAARREALLVQLADDSAEQRSLACLALTRELDQPMLATLQPLQRGGDAAVRRCVAALLAPMSPAAAARALAAPEPFVVTRALHAVLQSANDGAAARAAAATALTASGVRADVWRHAARAGLADTMLVNAARLGADAVPAFAVALDEPATRQTAIALLPQLGPAARAFVCSLLPLLRSRDTGAAARVLFAVGLRPGDAEWIDVVTEVRAAWDNAGGWERRELLPAIAALGDDGAFATDDLRVLIRDRAYDSMWVPFAPGGPLHGWVTLAAAGDASTQRQIALLLLASADLRRAAGQYAGVPAADPWRDVAASPMLRATMERLVARAPDAELRELLTQVLDAAASGLPLPATDVLLAARPELVAELLRERRRRQPLSRDVAAAIARSVPQLFVGDLLTDGAQSVAEACDELPRSAQVVDLLAQHLETGNCPHREIVLRLLIEAGEPASAAIVAELRRGQLHRAAMLAALCKAGSRAELFVPALRPLLAADASLAETVRLLGPAGLTAVVGALGTDAAVVHVIAAANGGDERTRCAAMRSLATTDPARAAIAARANRHAASPAVRRWSALLLLETRAEDVDAPLLLSLLDDEDPLLRRRGLEAFAAPIVWSTAAGIAVTTLLADPDPGVRRAAVQAFAAHRDEIAASRVALQEAAAAEQDPQIAALLAEVLPPR